MIAWTNDHRDWYRNVYLLSEHWKSLRKSKLSANPTCELCPSKDTPDVHHLRYKNLFDVEVSDLMTLCRSCHDQEHANNPNLNRRSRSPLFKSQNQLPPEVVKRIQDQTRPKYLRFLQLLADRSNQGRNIGPNLLKRLSDLRRMMRSEVEPG